MTGTYRKQGKGRSPALEKLADQARAAQRESPAPAQTTMLTASQITKRLELATGVAGDTAGCAAVIAFFLGMFAILGLVIASKQGAGDDGPLLVVLVVGGVVSIGWAMWANAGAANRRREAVAKELTWPSSQPFPVSGYRDWLVADRSVAVVEIKAPVERSIFVDAMRAIDPAIEVEAVDERSFQLVVPSRVVTGEHPVRFGNIPLLHQVFTAMLRPLHDDVGIERVTLGGTIQDR